MNSYSLPGLLGSNHKVLLAVLWHSKLVQLQTHACCSICGTILPHLSTWLAPWFPSSLKYPSSVRPSLTILGRNWPSRQQLPPCSFSCFLYCPFFCTSLLSLCQATRSFVRCKLSWPTSPKLLSAGTCLFCSLSVTAWSSVYFFFKLLPFLLSLFCLLCLTVKSFLTSKNLSVKSFVS